MRAPATAWQAPSAWQGTTDVEIELTNEMQGHLAPLVGMQPWELRTKGE
ncbi:hypothetical protein AB0M44_22945 [Streptosporangium subroseum]